MLNGFTVNQCDVFISVEKWNEVCYRHHAAAIVSVFLFALFDGLKWCVLHLNFRVYCVILCSFSFQPIHMHVPIYYFFYLFIHGEFPNKNDKCFCSDSVQAVPYFYRHKRFTINFRLRVNCHVCRLAGFVITFPNRTTSGATERIEQTEFPWKLYIHPHKRTDLLN